MKIINHLDTMLNRELLRKCGGDNRGLITSAFQRCKICTLANKARTITHHVQHMKFNGFSEEGLMELLDLF